MMNHANVFAREAIESPYRTRKETAEHFRKSPLTIDRWIAAGLLESKKIGRSRLVTVESIRRLEETGS